MNTMTHNLVCPECRAAMVLRPSRYGKFFGCSNFPTCRATHGAHPDGTPLGTPADKETKQWRIKAHDEFDKLWKNGGTMRRKDAYRHMRELMQMTPEEAHIGRFTIDDCKRLIVLLGGSFELSEASR